MPNETIAPANEPTPDPGPPRVVVHVNADGIPVDVTPIGVPMAALPTTLRIAAALLERRMGL